VILTGGLSQSNLLLMQLIADVLGRDVEVPQILHATAVGAAIHGAVAADVVRDYAEGALRWSAKDRLHLCNLWFFRIAVFGLNRPPFSSGHRELEPVR
jgi:sugar (pentulose or hexulose) kinase